MHGFPKDITNIIYRIVWSTLIKRCNEQYHVFFELTDSDNLLCKTSGIGINNRTDMLGGYRYIFHIFSGGHIRINDKRLKLPKNYF